MKPVSPELLEFLAGRQWYQADLYTITLQNGIVLQYCTGDADIISNSRLFKCGGFVGPFFDRSDNKAKFHQKRGTEADQLIFDCLPGGATIDGTSYVQAVREGQFDGATVLIERAYMPVYGDTSLGTLILFSGRTAEVDASKSVICFTCNTWMELLDLQWPRNFYQVSCVLNLGDSGCTVNMQDPQYRTAAHVNGVSTKSTIACAMDDVSPGTKYNLGTIVWTSGEMDGMQFAVKTVSGGGAASSIQLMGFMPAIPASGDVFALFFGCDKSSGLPITAQATLHMGVNVMTEVTPTQEVEIGATIQGPGIPVGTTVLDLVGTTVYMSANATIDSGVIDGTTVTFSRLTNDGCGKFNNLLHFRGFEFIPQPIAAV